MPVIARRSFLIGTALSPLAPSLLNAQASNAQVWPAHPATLIIPFPAGGAMDLLGRAVAQDLTDKLGQPFVVDNRVGAAGNIGAMAAAKAPPDGYTILMAGASSLALNKFMFATMPYDPEKELAPIVIVSKLPHILVVNPKVEAKTLKELVDYARANPGKLNAGRARCRHDSAHHAGSIHGADRRQDDDGDLSGRAADAHRSRRRPARFRLHLDDKPGAARSGRTPARARRDQRHPHAAIARCSDRGAGRFPRLRGRGLVRAGRAHGDAGRHHRQDQRHRERVPPQRQGQAGPEQARTRCRPAVPWSRPRPSSPPRSTNGDRSSRRRISGCRYTATLRRKSSTFSRRLPAAASTASEDASIVSAEPSVLPTAPATCSRTATTAFVPSAAPATLCVISLVAAFCCCERRGDRGRIAVDLLHAFGVAADRLDGARRRGLDGGDLGGDLLRCLGRLDGERLDFRCHHGEPPARFAGAGGLDRGVEREQVGLSGKLLDELDDVADLLRGACETDDLVIGRLASVTALLISSVACASCRLISAIELNSSLAAAAAAPTLADASFEACTAPAARCEVSPDDVDSALAVDRMVAALSLTVFRTLSTLSRNE